MKRFFLVFLVLCLFGLTAFASGQAAADGSESINMTHKMMQLVIQLAVILIVCRLFGLFFSKVLKQPSSLGEIISGIVIGPYALGALHFPGLGGPLFPLDLASGFAVSPELYGFAVVASIVLLFLSGLETDLPTFLRFSGKGSAVGLGGVIFSFILGDLCAVFFLPEVKSFMDPTALFLGTLSTATSVGITARLLTEKKQMASPEGVTILAGAVLDDVLGIIVLAIVVGISKSSSVAWGAIGVIAAKAFGFWLVCTVLGILIAPRITKRLKSLRSIQVISGISLGLAMILAGMSEMAGLAMIIGAYIMGLSFSQTDIAHQVRETLDGVSDFLIPIFFCVMGMMVNFASMKGVVGFGLIYTALAIVAKVVGCGLPAYLTGFNFKGSLRVGLGMLPRGEVALIVAGVGLSAGVINQKYFGVAVMMLLITTLMAPPLLVASFKGGSGYRSTLKTKGEKDQSFVEIQLGSVGFAKLFIGELLNSFRDEEFFVQMLDAEEPVYVVRKDKLSLSITQESDKLSVACSPDTESLVRLMIVEEVVKLKEMLAGLDSMKNPDLMGAEVMMNMFSVSEK